MIMGVINASMEKMEIDIDKEVLKAINDLRAFMFKKVYLRPFALEEEQKTFGIIESLYKLYVEKPQLMGDGAESGSEVLIGVRDYIAGMTDRFALSMFEKYFIPSVRNC